METLSSVFPAVPAPALERVLEICDGDVETASEWILENNWRDLLEGGGDGRANGDGEQANGGDAVHGDTVRQTEQPPAPLRASVSAAATATGAADSAAAPGLTISGDSAVSRTDTGLHVSHTSGASASRHHHSHIPGTSATAAVPALVGRALGRHDDRGYDSNNEHDGESDDYEEDEDEDDEDEDDEDDEDDDAHSYYDSGDDVFYHNSSGSGSGSALPLAKRIKITANAADDDAKPRDPKQEMYWVAFDGHVVRKTLIELLNTTLSKLAHSKVTLLNKSTKHIGELDAKAKLVSVLEDTEDNSSSTAAPLLSSRTAMDHILNDADAKPPAAATAAATDSSAPVASASASSAAAPLNGQKRKRSVDEMAAPPQPSSPLPLGFFAHFFSVSDLDMIWRSVMHAHLFNARFGDMIEFHTASCGVFNKRDFDELMHIHTNMASSRAASLGISPAAALKCCLILPCSAAESEIFRVGKHLHSLLKLQGSLYYRTLGTTSSSSSNSSSNSAAVASATTSGTSGTAPVVPRSTRLDLLNDDGKMTEDSFRRFARYRIRKEEHESTESKEAQALTPDHFLAYQQQRKVEYCLQALEADGWDRRLSS